MAAKKILIIEDDADTKEALRDILESRGYEVYTASDGADGLELLRRLKPRPCLVVLDLMMPNFNGWDFLDVQRNDPNLCTLPVAVCSAYVESAKAIRPSAVIPKPIQLPLLLKTVEKYSSLASQLH
jgi:CheY-like chemotaxis protein